MKKMESDHESCWCCCPRSWVVIRCPIWCFTPTTFPIRLTPFRHHADVWNVWEVCAGGTGLGVGHHGALHHCQNSCACTLGFHFYILHSPWLNILIFILEDSLNIIFEELIGKMRRILKLERIRTEWETVHVFNICVSYVARKACFQKL